MCIDVSLFLSTIIFSLLRLYENMYFNTFFLNFNTVQPCSKIYNPVISKFSYNVMQYFYLSWNDTRLHLQLHTLPKRAGHVTCTIISVLPCNNCLLRNFNLPGRKRSHIRYQENNKFIGMWKISFMTLQRSLEQAYLLC